MSFPADSVDRIAKLSAYAAAILGAIAGFNVGGIGGALLLALVALVVGWILAIAISGIVEGLLNPEGWIVFGVLVAIPAIFLFLVIYTWGMGK